MGLGPLQMGRTGMKSWQCEAAKARRQVEGQTGGKSGGQTGSQVKTPQQAFPGKSMRWGPSEGRAQTGTVCDVSWDGALERSPGCVVVNGS